MYITQGLKRAVEVNGDGIATIDGERRRSWREFARRVAKLAGAFRMLGLKDGGRVAILSFNSDRYLEFFNAVPWAGGIVMPLNIRLTPLELSFMLNDAGAEIVIVDDTLKNMLPELRQGSKTVRHFVLAGADPAPDGVYHYEDILAAADPVPDAERGGDDVAGIFYTGGTTGVPKGVMLTHRNAVSNAMSMLLYMYRGEPWVYLHAAPMFHIADCQWNTGVTLLAGTHVFIPRFNPELMLTTIQTQRITHSVLVPTMINLLANFPGVENYDLSSLKAINYGGSSMPPAVAAKAENVFPDCEFYAGYGQTETSPSITLLASKYHVLEGPCAGRLHSVGQPVFNMDVKIVDENDGELPHGKIGEIVTRGPHVMAGYWNNPRETEHVLRGGWMHTGDVGYMDQDGFIFIVDRLKDMIVSGGENVYSTEVENAIYQHPAVSMCAVFGIPSDKWGETVHAIVVLKEGQAATEEEIIDHCRKYIAGFKIPRSVEIRLAPLPMSGAGKILKKELRVPFWKGKTKQVN
jgi:long-chain acyl-CoA synthetase